MGPRRLPSAALAIAALAACDCGETALKRVSNNDVKIISPEDGATVVSSDIVDFHATAHNPAGVQSLTLRVGTQDLHTCPGSAETPEDVDCETTFRTPDFAGQIESNTLKLTAVALDSGGEIAEKSILVNIKPLRVSFKAPALNPRVSAEHAVVSGAGPLIVEVVSTLPVTEVQVGYDDGKRLAVWNALPYSKTVTWSTLGIGEHSLVARAIDSDGSEDTAKLKIKVVCTMDSQCPAGLRCCSTQTGGDGVCYATVNRGELCDCQHPCPVDQGCFPGTCGQTPRRCRPGCFPGDDDTRMDRCTDQDGRKAYCSQLPGAEATAENKGGACAPSDNCSIDQQNCPALPLDRTLPVSDSNPAKPQKCVPSSPTTAICMPAGPKRSGDVNCHESCGADALTTGCAAGHLCVQTVDENYQPIGPPHCSKLCLDPQELPLTPSRYCPSGEYCTMLMGAGHEKFSVGSCSNPYDVP